uniref:sorting nexin-21-like n=1 Tax=Gasterosteus aculeatus aculeatus TaxID=481459 RepID=UPI001A9A086A|nr:sorting nexin-21-like [Gasterosteus aculeatus aculeatus]XP_040050059.1 sorting nexin-21-like [Gasterosteus aculeatus aculeatus]XP_040050060.1 sorting nexin-21-like [Gasterosteus aculeatus aculeatus]XP_040050061.1 sorting nexin-21-like [Gasterosteus aculeatus aculeatus]
MASRLLYRLKRSLFKDGQGAGPEQESACGQEVEDGWEAELEEEEEERVTDRLGGTLSFDAGGGERVEDGSEELDSDSDYLGESMEEGLSSTDTSPVGVAPVGVAPLAPPTSFLLTRQLQESWRTLRGLGGGSPASTGRQPTDDLLFEVTDASVVQDASSKYVLYTIHVVQSAGSDKTPAVITCRYSDFQRLHAALRRDHGDQMGRVCFPRKKLRRNYTAETIGKRSRAFEQYLSHLCSLSGPRGAPCVRHFFYLADLQAGQLLIRIVVHGEPFLKTISPFSAKVFNYMKDFKLPKREALQVSNHLPVEVRLKSSALLLQATPLLILAQSFLSAL